MSFSSTRDEAVLAHNDSSGGSRLIWIIAGIAVFLATVAGGAYLILGGFGSEGSSSTKNANSARSYRTLAKTELRAEANQAAKLIVSLREGTTVSGISAGNQDGVDWLAVTAVDGTKGFAPKTLFKELSSLTSSTEIRSGMRRIVISTTVNLREGPSLSSKVLGVADGGTRMVSDGSVQSEGEDWLRVPIDGQTTVFIMQRFTTSDDDSGGDGFEGGAQSALGVKGFATQITNVQATPLANARIVRALQLNEEVRVIGQTNAGRAWYVLRLADGSQGFAPREAIRLDPTASRWVYPDGTEALGPNIPKGSTVALTAEQLVAAQEERRRARQRLDAAANPDGSTNSSTPANDGNVAQPKGGATASEPAKTPEQSLPKEILPTPGPQ